MKPELGLLFPAVDYISEKVLEQAAITDENTTIILDFTNVIKVKKKTYARKKNFYFDFFF